MDQQNTFSHGLLYSIEPQDLRQLHLLDDTNADEFEWDEPSGLGTLVDSVVALLKPAAGK